MKPDIYWIEGRADLLFLRDQQVQIGSAMRSGSGKRARGRAVPDTDEQTNWVSSFE